MDAPKPILSYARPKPRRPWFEPVLFALTCGFLGGVGGVVLAIVGWYIFSIFHPAPVMQYEMQEAALILAVLAMGGAVGLVCGTRRHDGASRSGAAPERGSCIGRPLPRSAPAWGGVRQIEAPRPHMSGT